MISEARRRPAEAFVWVWLPGASDPVVAARLTDHGPRMGFVYGRSYLERDDAISLSLPDLPLGDGEVLTNGDVPGCIADAGPPPDPLSRVAPATPGPLAVPAEEAAAPAPSGVDL